MSRAYFGSSVAVRGQSRREINSYRAPLSFQHYSSAFFLRHTLPTSPHPPALGGLCALSLLNLIIHRDCSSTVHGLSPFLFSFLFLCHNFLFAFFTPPLPLKHRNLQYKDIHRTKTELIRAKLRFMYMYMILSKFVKLASESRFNS